MIFNRKAKAEVTDCCAVTQDDVRKAYGEYRAAQQNEKFAEDDFVESAILYTNACKSRYDALLKRYKNQGNDISGVACEETTT